MNDDDAPGGSSDEEAVEGDAPEASPSHGRRRKKKSQRKDRLIQTRVPEGLESALKAEAHRRRLTVSHLIRNMLEDTFDLVDGVVEDVDQLVGDSMDLAFQVGEDAQKIARIAKRSADRFRTKRSESTGQAGAASEWAAGAGTAEEAGTARGVEGRPRLDHVLAWNEVLLNQDARCARCDALITKGEKGFLGLSQDPSKPPAWLCSDCAGDI